MTSVPILCEQGSAEWREARCGMITASRCIDVVAKLKSGKDEAASRRNYRAQIIAEILTGIPGEQYITHEMEWGTAQEPFARAAYELLYDVMVEQVGFVPHPDIARFGCSPDGLVGEEGMLQIKCPTTQTHLGWILGGTLPLEHAPQMLGELACYPERRWNDFVSFDPRLPKHLQLFIRRFERDDALIATLETEVCRFSKEIQNVLEALPQAPKGQPVVNIMDYMPKDEMEV